MAGKYRIDILHYEGDTNIALQHYVSFSKESELSHHTARIDAIVSLWFNKKRTIKILGLTAVAGLGLYALSRFF